MKYTESWSASMMSASLDLRTAKPSEGRQGNTLRWDAIAVVALLAAGRRPGFASGHRKCRTR
jgi:hypothetical protein